MTATEASTEQADGTTTDPTMVAIGQAGLAAQILARLVREQAHFRDKHDEAKDAVVKAAGVYAETLRKLRSVLGEDGA